MSAAQPIAAENIQRGVAMTTLRQAIIGMVSSPGPDLPLRQLAILLALDRPFNAMELHTLLAISKPSITRACDALVALKLVKRHGNPNDRRQLVIERTPRGEKFLGGLLPGAVS